MPLTKQNLNTVFEYHPPSPEQQANYVEIRAAAKVLAQAILDNTPQCADQQAALRHVREAVMTANAAVALEGLI